MCLNQKASLIFDQQAFHLNKINKKNIITLTYKTITSNNQRLRSKSEIDANVVAPTLSFANVSCDKSSKCARSDSPL